MNLNSRGSAPIAMEIESVSTSAVTKAKTETKETLTFPNKVVEKGRSNGGAQRKTNTMFFD